MDERPDMIDYVKVLVLQPLQLSKRAKLPFSGFQPNKLKEII